jgi:nucleoside-diphosphate-sugar epimerase
VVQALRGQALTIHGDGRQTRSFCYVTDLTEGLVRLMASEHGWQPVNLGNPRETTMLELAELACRLADSRGKIVFTALPQDDPIRRRPDITRARQLLAGWEPRVPLEEGLRNVVEDFRRRLAL